MPSRRYRPTKQRRLHVRVDEHVYSLVEGRCIQTGQLVSEVVRDALDQYLKPPDPGR